LVEQIRHILKLDKKWNVALIGAGNLGHALSNYNRYHNDSMRIVAIFDQQAEKVGSEIHQLKIQPMHELAQTVQALDVRIGIITVPASEAQAVADELVRAGISAILNFAPVILRAPAHVRIHHADFTTELQSLAYYLNESGKEPNHG
jgi:redox-sensing transcriptional repressor